MPLAHTVWMKHSTYLPPSQNPSEPLSMSTYQVCQCEITNHHPITQSESKIEAHAKGEGLPQSCHRLPTFCRVGGISFIYFIFYLKEVIVWHLRNCDVTFHQQNYPLP